MQASTIELMRDHVRAIFRALTGNDLPEPPPPPSTETAPPLSLDEVSRSFSELESLARHVPDVAGRVPPFSFSPPLDAFGNDREIVIEVGVPGIQRDDVEVSLQGDTLVVQGSRDIAGLVNGQTYYHAELPRGPFRRSIVLPRYALSEPRVEVERGLIRVRLARPTKHSTARA